VVIKAHIPDKHNPFYRSLRQARPSFSGERVNVISLPFGNPVFLFFLNPNSIDAFPGCSRGVVVGQYTHPIRVEVQNDFHFLAIHLQPYGLKQFLNIDASLLTNRYTDISSFKLTENLYQLLYEIRDRDELIPYSLDRFFDEVQCFDVSPTILQFVDNLNQFTGSKTSEFMNEIEVSEKTLLRKCKKEIGLTPKEQLRINRLFHIVHDLKQRNDWMQVVTDNHFTDQSHFIKEFKHFAELTPTHFIEKGFLPIQQLPPLRPFTGDK